MLQNFLKIAYRNLLKNKVYSLINILGLAIGMAACFFVFGYVRFELSYDRFHEKEANLYRLPITYHGSFAGNGTNAPTHPAVGPAMKAEFPEVIDFVRIASPTLFVRNVLFDYDEGNGRHRRFNERRCYFVDASFFRMFTFPFVAGDPKTALDRPGAVVITESTARKYFGASDPMNKVMHLNGMPLTVTGVCKDVPAYSHIKFDMVVPLNTASGGENFGYNEWGWPEFHNYVLLAPGADPRKLEAKLPAFLEKHLGNKWRELSFTNELHLQPIRDIHLQTGYKQELEAGGSRRTVYFLSLLGVFILVIAWINYINLSTAKSMERAREVGLRKVAGATRVQLSGQFILESLLINGVALLLAILIVIVAAPYFDRVAGKNISSAFLSSGLLLDWRFWLILLGVFVAGALQVGAYPAFVLSAFRPALVLKGKFSRSAAGLSLRKALVVFQFALSIILIAGTLILYRQLSYMRNQELGYNKEQLLVVQTPALSDSTFQSRVRYFKEELLKHPGIRSIAPSSEIPGNRIFARNGVRRASQDKAHNFVTNLVEIDHDFVPAYQLQLAAGGNLSARDDRNIFETLQGKALINEELAKRLGFPNAEAAVGQQIAFVSWFGDVQCEVAGVVKNYHQRSLKESYEPILYYYNNRSNWGYFSISLDTKDLRRHLSYIEQQYHRIFPGNAFESFFLDEYFNRQYLADQQLGGVFSLFTVLAIIVACLGLTGLSTFTIRLRTKEIGIRKVLGATTEGIIYLFSRDFIRLVGLAALLAFPVIFFGRRQVAG